MAIVKIPAGRLVPGMYLHDLGAGWMDHPFLRGRFLVKSEREVARIVEAGIVELWIDTERGSGLEAPSAAEAPAPAAPPAPVKASFAEEIGRARLVRERALTAVNGAMHAARLGKALDIAELVPVVDEVCRSLERNSGALLSLAQLRNKDNYTFSHCVSVCTLLAAFGRSLGLDARTIAELGLGGLVHDLGKTSVPDSILKKPGRLTAEEFAVIKQHPPAGEEILRRAGEVGRIAHDITRHHHERFDGTGYPDGLRGEAIPFAARLAAVADVYDALTSERCYHRAAPPTEALRRMLGWGGSQLERGLVERFVRCVGIYPVGSLVRLKSERIAVVIEHDPADLLRPQVRVLYDARAGRHTRSESLVLARGGDAIVCDEPPERWGLDPVRYLAGAEDAG